MQSQGGHLREVIVYKKYDHMDMNFESYEPIVISMYRAQNIVSYYMAGSASGQDESNPVF